jgi:hypothetical protein
LPASETAAEVDGTAEELRTSRVGPASVAGTDGALVSVGASPPASTWLGCGIGGTATVVVAGADAMRGTTFGAACVAVAGSVGGCVVGGCVVGPAASAGWVFVADGVVTVGVAAATVGGGAATVAGGVVTVAGGAATVGGATATVFGVSTTTGAGGSCTCGAGAACRACGGGCLAGGSSVGMTGGPAACDGTKDGASLSAPRCEGLPTGSGGLTAVVDGPLFGSANAGVIPPVSADIETTAPDASTTTNPRPRQAQTAALIVRRSSR